MVIMYVDFVYVCINIGLRCLVCYLILFLILLGSGRDNFSGSTDGFRVQRTGRHTNGKCQGGQTR